MTAETQFHDVYGKIKGVVAEVFSVEEKQLALETNLVADLGAESLDIVTLLMEFEDTFDKKIPDEEAEKLLTIGDAVNYIIDMSKEPV